MKNEIRFTLKTYLGQHRIMNGYQAVRTILQDTDWIKRVYCISRMELKKK